MIALLLHVFVEPAPEAEFLHAVANLVTQLEARWRLNQPQHLIGITGGRPVEAHDRAIGLLGADDGAAVCDVIVHSDRGSQY